MKVDPNKIEVIAPNLKRRLSGVTSTVMRLVPIQSEAIQIATTGPKLHHDIPQIPLWKLLTMSRSGPSGDRVWHARRNIEMLAGLLLSWVLGKRFKFVLTTAAQRRRKPSSMWLIKKMDVVIAASQRTATYLDVPTTVIRHGIDTKAFVPADDVVALRRSLGLDPSAVIIGCYGRIRAQKGTDVFSEAMISLLPKYPEMHAVIMGRTTGEHQGYCADLKQRIRASGYSDRLRILPEQDWSKMASWYAALDIYVAPQRWEGFGLTPLEAMSCGIPVVATRVGAFEELVVDGETGFLIPPDNSKGMADATEKLLANSVLRRRMSSAARQKVLRDHDITEEAKAITAVYRELLAKTS